jgi:hypothetical protein
LKKHWALGFVPEVMHGVVYKPVGVCYHQCWSETNILHPAINGMIGWRPDAPSHTAVLAPRFPMLWDSMTVRHMRVGSSFVSVRMIRGINQTTYTLNVEKGPAVKIAFSPEIARGMQLDGVTVNGVARGVQHGTKRGLLAEPVSVELEKQATVVFRHRGGAAMFPVVSNPASNDSSQGYKMVTESVKDSVYEAVLEGKAGTSFMFQLRLFDQTVKSVEGGEAIGLPENGVQRLRVSFDSSGSPFAQKRVRLVLAGL